MLLMQCEILMRQQALQELSNTTGCGIHLQAQQLTYQNRYLCLFLSRLCSYMKYCQILYVIPVMLVAWCPWVEPSVAKCIS